MLLTGLWGWNAETKVENHEDYKNVELDISKKYSQDAYLKLLTWIDQRNELWNLYSVVIYDENDNVIFNGIPCKEKLTGEYGVFDTVKTKFYGIK